MITASEHQQKTIQVYFTKESGLHDLNITSDIVNHILIADGFLKIHDVAEGCWHCYNVNCVRHYHVPDGGINDKSQY